MDMDEWADVLKIGWVLYKICKEIYKYFNRKSPKPKSNRKKRKGKRH